MTETQVRQAILAATESAWKYVDSVPGSFHALQELIEFAVRGYIDTYDEVGELVDEDEIGELVDESDEVTLDDLVRGILG